MDKTRKSRTYKVGANTVQFFTVPGVPGWYRVFIDGIARFWISPDHKPSAKEARYWAAKWAGQ